LVSSSGDLDEEALVSGQLAIDVGQHLVGSTVSSRRRIMTSCTIAPHSRMLIDRQNYRFGWGVSMTKVTQETVGLCTSGTSR
jgi:hypothetical protein